MNTHPEPGAAHTDTSSDVRPGSWSKLAPSSCCSRNKFAEGRVLFGWVCGRLRRVPLVGLYGSSEVPALFSLQALDLPVEKRIAAGAPGFRA